MSVTNRRSIDQKREPSSPTNRRVHNRSVSCAITRHDLAESYDETLAVKTSGQGAPCD